MNTRTCRGAGSGLMSAVVLSGVLALLGPSAARADMLSDFTGYTRPGVPAGKATEKGGKIVFVALEGQDRKNAVLGGTVYFTVIDMAGRDEDDPWIRIAKQLRRTFVPGRDSAGGSSPDFDGGARFLYLYQTVNDMPEARDAVRATSVFLFDPALVTSWGHFDGHGFSFLAEKKGKTEILPASYADPINPENRVYRNPDTEHLADNLFRIGHFAGRGRNDVRPAAEGEDPVRSPDTVILQLGANWNSTYPYVGWDAGAGRLWPRPNGVEASAGGVGAPRSLDNDWREQPLLRANWIGRNLLKPRERSAIFGFTSNAPPTYEPVSLRGVPAVTPTPGGIRPAAAKDVARPGTEGIAPAATDGIAPASGNAPVGSVPTPVPPTAAAAAAVAPVGGMIGGQMPVGGGVGGGGLPVGGLGGFGAAPPPFVPGAIGGTSGGNGNGTGSQQQPQTQSQSQSQSQGPVTINQTFNNNCCPPSNMVPEPSGALLALLGAPVLFLLFWARRRRVAGVSV